MERLTYKSKFFVILSICSIFVLITISHLVYYDPLQSKASSFYFFSDRFVDGWDPNITRDPSVYVMPSNVTTLIKPKDFCDTPTFLLVMVCSAPLNFEARQAIRDTWSQDLNISGKTTHTYFLMGETNNTTVQQMIFEESERYNDIIQEKFVDSYNNLTLKSLMMLKLVESSCLNNVKYLMKTDDDMYVHLTALVRNLEKRRGSLMIGALHCRAQAIRYSSNKWYAPKYMFPDKYYPPYLSGTGYVMSIDIASKLYRAAMLVPIFYLEDVYLTGIVAKSAGLRPRGDQGFSFSTRKMEPCAFQNAYTSHRVTPSDLHKIFDILKDIDSINCKVEPKSIASDSTLTKIINFFSKEKTKKRVKPTCS